MCNRTKIKAYQYNKLIKTLKQNKKLGDCKESLKFHNQILILKIKIKKQKNRKMADIFLHFQLEMQVGFLEE